MYTTMDHEMIKKRIHELAGEIPAEECQNGVKQLDKAIQEFDAKLPIQKFPSGNYWYFRTVEYQYPGEGKKTNILREKLGRITKKDYKKHEKVIDELMRTRDKDKIKEYLEDY